MKVALCLPIYGDTKALFTYSLTGMILWSQAQNWNRNGVDTKPIFTRHMSLGMSQVQEARERCAADAMSKDVDYLLWLDADQTFPEDTLYRLLRHGLPFVGCNYRKRVPHEVISTAHRMIGGEMIPIEPRAEGVEPVVSIGLGVCLIRASVFAAIPRPWFKMEGGGEDTYFSQAAKKAGFQPHVDHALSMEVGHIAEEVLRFPA